MGARDVALAPRCCRDVTDGALGGSAERQGARSTSSGGYNSVCTVDTHQYPAYGTVGAVTGATPGRPGRRKTLGHLGGDPIRKGVKVVIDIVQ